MDEEQAKKAEKKRKQAEAWKRWWTGPKGLAYKLKRKMKDAGVEPVKS